ncbi:DUF1648 domain-containing protein [Desnuesiella massiliensis]|uniref:DUF1648 domain-containing protein n=1 Tax=Desnuesiella massiliensis TaxID=1650662 RepID=UPI0006E43D06|nr:DUF1648 domain-containing protein [Desnuesiella massiliensis]
MKKEVRFTVTQKIIEVITAGMLLFLIAYLAINWSSIPDKIPSHYNSLGIADAWSRKTSIIMPPIISIILYTSLTLLSFFPAIWNTPVQVTDKNYSFVYQNTRSLICYLKLVLVGTFSYMTICAAQGKALGKLFLPLELITIFGVILWFIVKIVRGANKTK